MKREAQVHGCTCASLDVPPKNAQIALLPGVKIYILKKKRRYLRGWPLFFETFHVRVIHLKIKYFITTQIEKIRQNLL